ncbi:MucBP domain-containing protein [Vagococcus coleopterorum]|uniref:MucBP domain-containing protein n=1 Tax=Vagococcus coleopterorum TaxID=2714946 RepID=A0A6G8AMN7_9ENTE|nr:MucBP domain-containing protein [Vagococcus coleopterorum]QIL46212.1 MucBP domain-containing protein [Vagococcus coleopterorum]
MKKINICILGTLLFFVTGQQFAAQNFYQNYSKDIVEQKKVYARQEYFIKNNTLWYLDRIIGNPSGKITKDVQTVNYIYKKSSIKEWLEKYGSETTNKQMITKKKDPISGNASMAKPYMVKALMEELSGRICYGEYTKNKKKWF